MINNKNTQINKLAVSILAADFSQLGNELRIAERAGAHYAHIDVMDGVFVPNISVGIPVLQSLRRHSNLVFDVHLMIQHPENYIAAFAEAGADIITFHLEAAKDPYSIINTIKLHGKKTGISINPATPIEALFEYLPMVDMALLMSVEPGFGGQHFKLEALTRANNLRKHINTNKLTVDIQMDGGITHANAADVVNAGVNILVTGTAVFGANDKTKAIKQLLALINGGNTQ